MSHALERRLSLQSCPLGMPSRPARVPSWHARHCPSAKDVMIRAVSSLNCFSSAHFVWMSATISVVEQKAMSMSFPTWCLIRIYRVPMWWLRGVILSRFMNRMQFSASMLNRIAPCGLPIASSSIFRCSVYLSALPAAIISASVLDRAGNDCFVEDQCTGAPFSTATKPLWLAYPSSPAKLASVQISSRSFATTEIPFVFS